MSNADTNTAPTQTQTQTVEERTALLRRHGLDVDENSPEKVEVVLDVPFEMSASKLDTLIWLVDEVENRIISQEFCNSRGPIKRGHQRVGLNIILAKDYTEKATAHTVYMAVRDQLIDTRDRLKEREARGEDVSRLTWVDDDDDDPDCLVFT